MQQPHSLAKICWEKLINKPTKEITKRTGLGREGGGGGGGGGGERGGHLSLEINLGKSKIIRALDPFFLLSNWHKSIILYF